MRQTVAFLESDDCLEEVESMSAEARKKGVTGVPFVIIDGRWAVIGGQSADVYTQASRAPRAAMRPLKRAPMQIFRKLAQTEKTNGVLGHSEATACGSS